MSPSAAGTPVIPGFFPDPTVCRVGGDYYLASSSFEYFPGAPVFHSRDLVAWEQVGNILTRRTQFAAGDRRGSGGIFGSTLRHHNGQFWFITTNMSDFGGGHLLFRATDPAGPWSEPVQIAGTLGIDPDIAWDQAGNCYLTWVGFGPGPGASGIVQARLDTAGGHLLEAPRKVWQGAGLAFPEGPHLYQVGDWWYLMLAEGGTERGHAVSISRSTSPAGPFEACPGNPILSHRSLDTPVQNTGHADLVQKPDGTWAAVYLGVRTGGASPGYHVLGRETFLSGVTWQDGWPGFDQAGYQVPASDHSFVEDFAAPELHPRWVSPGDEPAAFTSRPAADGGLELAAGGPDSPRLLATRLRDADWTCRAAFRAVDAGAELVLRIDSRHWYAVRLGQGLVQAVARIGPLTQELATAAPRPGAPLQLEVSAGPAAQAGQPSKNFGPDDVILGFRQAGHFTELARLDGRYLSTEVAGGFTGRVIGVSALGGPAVLDRFEYLSAAAAPGI